MASSDELHKLLHTGDPDGDVAFRILKLDTSNRALARLADEDPELFKRLLKVPEWVDWELLELGQEIFRRYFTAMFISLSVALLASFLNAEINRVLLHSHYWAGSTRNNFQRLVETASWVFSTSEPGEMRPLCKGWRLTLRVRLLHSKVRQHVLEQVFKWGPKIAGQRAMVSVYANEIHYNDKNGRGCPYANTNANDDGWDGLGGGVPINQLHLRSTLMSFHGFPLKILKQQFGVQLSKRELDGFTMHWRWVSHLLGVEDAQARLRDYQEAEQWDQVLTNLTLRGLFTEKINISHGADQTSIILTRQVLTTYQKNSEMARLGWSKWWTDVFRIIVGDEIADQLEIPSSSPARPLASLIFRLVGWVYRLADWMGLNQYLLSASKIITRWTIERKCQKFGINPKHVYPPFPW